MSEEFDFDRYWLDKLSENLSDVLETDSVQAVMQGSESITDCTSREEVVEWTRGAMERLAVLATEGQGRCIMAGCACQYPRTELEPLREAYNRTRDISVVMEMLQTMFEGFLSNTLGLEPAEVERLSELGWGMAGIRERASIHVTKMPKSGHLVEYLASTDAEERRRLYCHCPRVREAVSMGVQLPILHCYCGAGFYRDMWKEITQEEVEVEVLETVLSGGEVCRFRIHLPIDG